MPKGFVLGDHQFQDPSEPGDLDRLDEPKRQILGAAPPTYLEGIAREATADSPAAQALFEGEFCGHGEPTMTVFDIVIDGSETLEIGLVPSADQEETGSNPDVLAVRKPGGEWIALFRGEWELAQQGLEGVARTPLTPEELEGMHPEIATGRVSIGFEYPCDATSRDEVSWLTIDLLMEGEEDPVCLVNAELF